MRVHLSVVTRNHPKNTPRTKKHVPFWREGSDKGSIDPFCSEKLFSGTNLSAIQVTQPGHHRTATRRLGPSPMRTFRPNRSSIKIWSLSVHCATKMVGFKAPQKNPRWFCWRGLKNNKCLLTLKSVWSSTTGIATLRIVFCWFSPFQMVPLQCGTWFQKTWFHLPKFSRFAGFKKVSSTKFWLSSNIHQAFIQATGRMSSFQQPK